MRRIAKRSFAALLAFILLFTSSDLTGLKTYADDVTPEVVESTNSGSDLEGDIEEIEEEETVPGDAADYNDGSAVLVATCNVEFTDEYDYGPAGFRNDTVYQTSIGCELQNDCWFSLATGVPDEFGNVAQADAALYEGDMPRVYFGEESATSDDFELEIVRDVWWRFRAKHVGEYTLSTASGEVTITSEYPSVGFYNSATKSEESCLGDRFFIPYGTETVIYALPKDGVTITGATWEANSENNSPDSFIGGSASKDENNIVTFTLNGESEVHVNTNFTIEGEDYNPNPWFQARVSNKGLLVADDWNGNGFNKNFFRKDVNMVENEERLIYFGYCDSDEIPENFVGGDDADDLNDPESESFSYVIDKRNEDGKTYSPDNSNGIKLEYDNNSHAYRVCASQAGTYRISGSGTGSFIVVNVSPQTLYMNVYDSAECAIPVDGKVYNTADGIRIYAKSWVVPGASEKSFEIKGYSIGNYLNLNKEVDPDTIDEDKKLTPDENGVAFIDLPGGLYNVDMNIYALVTEADGKTRYQDICIRIESSMKGLVYSDYFDQYGLVMFDNGHTTFRKGDSNWTQDDERSIAFAFCGKSNFDEITEADLTVLDETASPKLEVFRYIEDGFVTPDEGDCELRLEGNDYRFRASVPGTYRLQYNVEDTEYEEYLGSNYVDIIVNPRTLFWGIFSDVSCNEEAREIYAGTAGTTLYARAWKAEDATEDVSVYGYATFGLDPNDPSELGRATKLTPNGNGVAMIKLDPEFNGRIWVIFAINHGDGNIEYRTEEAEIRESEMGLVAIDWIEREDINGEIDYETVRRGENARYSKGMRFDPYDERLVLFAENSLVYLNDNAESDQYTPVTSGITVKRFDGEGWVGVTNDEISLTYVGNKTGIPEGYSGLWIVKTTQTGQYRLIHGDTHVDLTVYLPRVAFYDTDDANKIALNTLMPRDRELYVGKTYILDARDEEPSGRDGGKRIAEFTNIRVDYQGEEYSYDFEEESWPEGSNVPVYINQIGEAQYIVRFDEPDIHFCAEIKCKETWTENEQLCEEYYNDDRVDTHVCLSNKGLVVRSEIDWHTEGDRYVIDRFRDNEYRKEFGSCLFDDRFVVFATNYEEDRIDYENVSPVTDELYVQMRGADGNWTTVSDVTLKYMYDSESMSEDYVGLWYISAPRCGEYRIVNNRDDSYVRFNVSLPRAGLYYDEPDVEHGEGTYVGPAIFGSDSDEPARYLAYWHDFDNEGNYTVTNKDVIVHVHDTDTDYHMNASRVWVKVVWDDENNKFVEVSPEVAAPDQSIFPIVNISSKKPTANIEISNWGKYNICLTGTFTYKDRTDPEDDNRWYDVRENCKGLVWSDYFEDDRVVTVDNKGFSTYRKSDDNWLPGDERWISFAVCDSEELTPSAVRDAGLNGEYGGVYVEYLDEEGDYSYAPSYYFSLKLEKINDTDYCWKATAGNPGTYRLSAHSGLSGFSGGECYAYITVMPRFAEVYTDASCKEASYLENEWGERRPGAYLSGDATTYYFKAWTGVSGESIRYAGYSVDRDYDLNDPEQKKNVKALGTTTDGFTVSEADDKGVITVTASKDALYRDLIIYMVYDEDPENVRYYTTRIWNWESSKGLCVNDWIEYDSEYDEPLYETVSFGRDGDNYSVFRKEFPLEIGENKYVVFGINPDDEGHGDYYAIYSPVKKGLTVKRKSGEEWVADTGVSLQFAGNKSGLNSAYSGLWRITASKCGDYRICYSDGTYVSLTVTLPSLAVYNTDKLGEISEDTLADRDNLIFREGESNTYILYMEKDAGGEALNGKIDIIDLEIEGRKASYNFTENKWDYDAEEWGQASSWLPTMFKLTDVSYMITVKHEHTRFETVRGTKTFAEEGRNPEEFWSDFYFDEARNGLVIAPVVSDENYQPTSEVANPKDYSKYLDSNFTYACDFALAINKKDTTPESFADVTRLQGSLGKFTIKRDGTEVSDSVAKLVYSGKYIYSFEASEEGFYELIYTDADASESHVYIDIRHIYFNFYKDDTFTEKITNEEVELTVDELLAGKKELYFTVEFDDEEFADYGFLLSRYAGPEYMLCAHNYITGPIKIDTTGVKVSGPEIIGTDGNLIRYKVTVTDNGAGMDQYYQIQGRMYNEDEEGNLRADIWEWPGVNFVAPKLDASTVSAEIESVTYTGTTIMEAQILEKTKFYYTPANGTKQELKAQFSVVKLENAVNAGTAKVTFAGLKDLKFEAEFTIKKANVETCRFLPVAEYSTALKGANETLEADINGVALPKSSYDAEFGYVKSGEAYVKAENYIPGGIYYYVKITGKDNLEGETYVKYLYRCQNIMPAYFVGGEKTLSNEIKETLTYTGETLEISPIIEIAGYRLVKDKDYVIEYEEVADRKTAGTSFRAFVHGKGNYAPNDDICINVTILPAKLSKVTLKVGEEAVKSSYEFSDYLSVYNGNIDVYVGDKKLTKDKDYTFVRPDECVVGANTFTVIGTGNYTGTVNVKVTANADSKLTAKNTQVTVAKSYPYTGKAIEINKSDITVKINGTEIDRSKYDVTTSSVKAGTGILTITGKTSEGLTGTVTAKFTITKANMSNVTVTGDHISNYAPSGLYGNIKLALGSVELVEGVDYTVKYEASKITVTPKGSLEGDKKELDASFMARDVSECDLSETVTKYYVEKATDTAEPVVILKDGNRKLVKDTDYTYVVKDGSETVTSLKTGKTYTITVSGKGNYKNELSLEATVEALSRIDISKDKKYEIVLSENEFVYSSYGVEPEVTLREKSTQDIVAPDNYSVQYEKNYNAGTAKVNVIAKGTAYEGTLTKTFTINPLELTASKVSADVDAVAYLNKKGKVVAPEYRIYAYYDDDRYLLTNKKDYTISFTTLAVGKNVEAKLTFKGNFKGTVTVDLGGVDEYYVKEYTSTSLTDLTYTGKALKQNLKVGIEYYNNEGGTAKVAAKKTKAGKDYKINYSRKVYKYTDDNGVDVYDYVPVDELKDAGTYLAELEFIGKYSGPVDALGEFTVKPASLSGFKVTLAKNEVDFSKDDLSPAVKKVEHKKLGVLEEYLDYEVTYKNNDKPGTASVIITGIGNFSGELVTTYKITGKTSLTDCIIEVGDTATYSAAGSYPEIAIFYEGVKLQRGKDYKVSADRNAVGTTAKLTIEGIGQYQGKEEATFTINKADLSDADYVSAHITFGNAKATTEDGYFVLAKYSGNEIKADPKLKVDGKLMTKDTDYTITVVDDTFNECVAKNAGFYTLIIEGKGNYENELCVNMQLYVQPLDIGSAKASSKKPEYDPAGIYDAITKVTYGSGKKAKTLTATTDYEVSYNSKYEKVYDKNLLNVYGIKTYVGSGVDSEDNITPGKRTAYIIGKGNYTGVKAVTYEIKGLPISNKKIKISINNISAKDLYDSDMLSVITENVNATYKLSADETVKLVPGTDFEVTSTGLKDIFLDNTSGKKTAVIKGLGRFSGTLKVKYTLNAINVVSEGLEIIDDYDDPDYEFKAAGVKPDPSRFFISLCSDDLYLNYLVEKKVAKVAYSNNKAPAMADSKKAPTMTVTFSKIFTGKLNYKFNIVKADVGDLDVTVSNITPKLDKGYVKKFNDVKAAPVVKDGTKKLKAGKDYTLRYVYAEDSIVMSGNKLVGREAGTELISTDKIKPGTKIRVYITGLGNYTGTDYYEYYLLSAAAR